MKSVFFLLAFICLSMAATTQRTIPRRPHYKGDSPKKPYPPVFQKPDLNDRRESGLQYNPGFQKLDYNNVTLLHYENYNDGLGPYAYSFQSSDGIARQESSQVTGENKEGELSIVVTGSYSFIAPDGVTYTVNYIADENGYRVL